MKVPTLLTIFIMPPSHAAYARVQGERTRAWRRQHEPRGFTVAVDQNPLGNEARTERSPERESCVEWVNSDGSSLGRRVVA